MFLRKKHCVSMQETLCFHVDDRKNHVHFPGNVPCFLRHVFLCPCMIYVGLCMFMYVFFANIHGVNYCVIISCAFYVGMYVNFSLFSQKNCKAFGYVIFMLYLCSSLIVKSDRYGKSDNRKKVP